MSSENFVQNYTALAVGATNGHWEQWDEDRTGRRPALHLDAATYQVERLFDDPPRPSPRLTPEYVVSRGGNFAYQNTILPAGTPLKLCGKRAGLVIWNGDVVLPMLVETSIRQDETPFPAGTPKQHRVAHGAVWMSLTPAEMISQRGGIDRAKGKVLVGGLGLGWFLRKVCEKPSVTEVIVVERSEEILDWYGYRVCANQPKVKDVICDDVYTQIGCHGDCEYLLDIWLGYGDAKDDHQFRAAKKRLGKRLWGWGA
jgi:hypothetical protein